MNYFGIGIDNYSIGYSDFQQSYNTFGDDYNCFPNTYNHFNENHFSFDNSCSSFSETYCFNDNYLNYTPSYEHLEINLNNFKSFCHDTYDNFGDAGNLFDNADLLSDFDYDLYRSYNEAATCFNNKAGVKTVDLFSFGIEEDTSLFSAESSAVNSPPADEGMNENTDAICDPVPSDSYAANSSFGIINDFYYVNMSEMTQTSEEAKYAVMNNPTLSFQEKVNIVSSIPNDLFDPNIYNPYLTHNFDTSKVPSPDALGISADLSTISGLSGGGGTYGLNLEWTRTMGLHLYTYQTPVEQNSEGIDIGFSFTANAAIGDGSWEGPFDSFNGSYGSITGGFFHSPLEDKNPGYFGVQGGFAWGTPGIRHTMTNYDIWF